MNKRLLTVLAFALVISAVASWVLYRLIVTKLASGSKPATTQVLVASRNIDIGTLLKDADVKMVEWHGPEPKGSLGSAAAAVGRGVVANIYEGEPILENRLAGKGAGAGLAATIPQGMRAVSIRVNDVGGVSGFVRPGARVDVLIAGNPPGTSNTMGVVSKTLLQNMEVLSAGQDMQKDSEGKPVSVPVVNLLATPEQAETLSLASSEMRIQLVLRNPLDTKTVTTPGTAVSNLFTGETGLPQPRPMLPRVAVKPVVAKAAPKPVVITPAEPPKPTVPLTVEVITGTTRAETKFKPDGGKQ